jgi:hypothetical protein
MFGSRTGSDTPKVAPEATASASGASLVKDQFQHRIKEADDLLKNAAASEGGLLYHCKKILRK